MVINRITLYAMRSRLVLLVLASGIALLSLSYDVAQGQDAAQPQNLREALAEAERAARGARARSRELERQAQDASRAEDHAHRQLAALAAKVQVLEAQAQANEARLELLRQEQRLLARELAREREPLVHLTAALQRASVTPPALAALLPRSLKETVHLRAVLEQTVPAVQQRTAGLRAQVRLRQQLDRQVRNASRQIAATEAALTLERRELETLALANRRQSRVASRAAVLESRRATELALEATSLDDLVTRIDGAANLRAQLAALPGPVPRPGTGPAGASRAARTTIEQVGPRADVPVSNYRLPVAGPVVAGFGETGSSGIRTSSIALRPRTGALVVAPSAGRVAFAGGYEGYGEIVILEHDERWTSIVTGLASLRVAAGDRVVANQPLGLAARSQPVTLELRREGRPVDPLRIARLR